MCIRDRQQPVKTVQPSVPAMSSPPTLSSDYNVWKDPERLKTIRQPSTVVICQDSGEQVPITDLENIITNNGIKVNNTFSNKSGQTVVTTSSPADRSKLVQAINESFPATTLQQPKDKLPTISISGIRSDMAPENLSENIMKVNSEVKTLVDTGESLSILAVKEQRNSSPSNKLFQATV